MLARRSVARARCAFVCHARLSPTPAANYTVGHAHGVPVAAARSLTVAHSLVLCLLRTAVRLVDHGRATRKEIKTGAEQQRRHRSGRNTNGTQHYQWPATGRRRIAGCSCHAILPASIRVQLGHGTAEGNQCVRDVSGAIWALVSWARAHATCLHLLQFFFPCGIARTALPAFTLHCMMLFESAFFWHSTPHPTRTHTFMRQQQSLYIIRCRPHRLEEEEENEMKCTTQSSMSGY